MALTEAQVRAKVERLCEAAADPVLTADDVTDLVAMAKRVDDAGRDPADAEWEPTWSLWAAVAEGWQRKASKAAGTYSFSDQGQSFDRGEVVDHCLKMADRYARRVHGSVHVAPRTHLTDSQIVNL